MLEKLDGIILAMVRRNLKVLQTELGETVTVTRETGIACSQN